MSCLPNYSRPRGFHRGERGLCSRSRSRRVHECISILNSLRVELYSVLLKRYTRCAALLNLRIRCIKQDLQSGVLSISLEAYIGGLNDRQQGWREKREPRLICSRLLYSAQRIVDSTWLFLAPGPIAPRKNKSEITTVGYYV